MSAVCVPGGTSLREKRTGLRKFMKSYKKRMPISSLLVQIVEERSRDAAQLVSKHVTLCGTVLSVAGQSFTLLDAFGRVGINIPEEREESLGELCRSKKNKIVVVDCRFYCKARAFLVADSLEEIGVHEEMYRTLEMIELWERLGERAADNPASAKIL